MDNGESAPLTPDAGNEARYSIAVWLSDHRTHLVLLAALSFAVFEWMPHWHRCKVDTAVTDTLGLSAKEMKDYQPTRIAHIPDKPYIYCEFEKRARTWKNQNLIGVLIDAESGNRLLRVAWRNGMRFRLFSCSGYEANGYPMLFPGKGLGIHLSGIRSRGGGLFSRVVAGRGYNTHFFAELTEEDERIVRDEMELWWGHSEGTTDGNAPLCDGPVHKQLMQQDGRRVFSEGSPRLDPKQLRFYNDDTLLFYLDGTLRTIKPDGTDEKQIFPLRKSEQKKGSASADPFNTTSK